MTASYQNLGIVCRQCRSCKMGKQNLCMDRKPLGFILDGAFAEYIKVPDINVHPYLIACRLKKPHLLNQPLSVCTRLSNELKLPQGKRF